MTSNQEWLQKQIRLKPKRRGFHLIDDEILASLPQIQQIEIGMLHFFLLHTSASLCLNENADPTVRLDLEAHLDQIIPEQATYYQHTYEGPDDMPAHIKTGLLGNQLSIPIGQGRLLLGTWQGIYLGEHRNHPSSRQLIATIQGQTKR